MAMAAACTCGTFRRMRGEQGLGIAVSVLLHAAAAAVLLLGAGHALHDASPGVEVSLAADRPAGGTDAATQAPPANFAEPAQSPEPAMLAEAAPPEPVSATLPPQPPVQAAAIAEAVPAEPPPPPDTAAVPDALPLAEDTPTEPPPPDPPPLQAQAPAQPAVQPAVQPPVTAPAQPPVQARTPPPQPVVATAPPRPARPAPQAAAQRAPAPRPGHAAPPGATPTLAAGLGQGLGSPPPAADDGPLLIANPRFRMPPIAPRYPMRARDLGQEGEVVVRARLDRSGTPEEVVVHRSSGFDLLDRAALAAVRRWAFEPGRRGGMPVAAWVQVPVRFALR